MTFHIIVEPVAGHGFVAFRDGTPEDSEAYGHGPDEEAAKADLLRMERDCARETERLGAGI